MPLLVAHRQAWNRRGACGAPIRIGAATSIMEKAKQRHRHLIIQREPYPTDTSYRPVSKESLSAPPAEIYAADLNPYRDLRSRRRRLARTFVPTALVDFPRISEAELPSIVAAIP
jgi:hypothetical protein